MSEEKTETCVACGETKPCPGYFAGEGGAPSGPLCAEDLKALRESDCAPSGEICF